MGPVGASSRTWRGAILGLGLGALLLPVALLPGCVAHAGAKAMWLPTLAQDAVVRQTGPEWAALGRGRLRLTPARLLAYAASNAAADLAADSTRPAPDTGPDPSAPAPTPSPDPGPCGEAGWFTPAPGAAISQPFGNPDPAYAAGYHTGVDFAVFNGTPLLAVADAVVEVAGWGGAYGHWIVLRLPDGHFALYAHMSRLDVHTGDHVAAGSRLGLSGESGNARGPHLHFEIRNENHYGAVVDPLPYLRAHGCRV
ncbi:M23 family metallopeptidase [Streptacidiphilus neutrinimicus]|uniref:M23 family metallopeptidase n=1 Tax=Streptacidiphilus neutrinimicus TaxID=105420 RepID=UPI000693CA1B|nr:M23 family metallopeptidase [Streptacidiphilus neutrinimicus]